MVDLQYDFELLAEKNGLLELAEEVTKVIGRANHFPGLAKNVAKVKLPRKLVPIAQTFVDRLTPEGFSDFQIAYGLVFLLAKEGSTKSWRIVAAFADRAIAAAKDETVVNPAELLARFLPRSPLKKKLADMEEERVSASESQMLAKKLELPVGDVWSAAIWLGEDTPNTWFGANQKGPQIHLAIDPAEKPDWKVDLHGEKDGIYSNWGGKVSQDDFGLPKLARLEAFPAWVRGAGKKLKVTFSIDLAVIGVRKKRSANELLRDWLRGG